MRSRAEARWAAFFDEWDWKWQYEPLDLDGYIPDFLIQIPGEDNPNYPGEWEDVDSRICRNLFGPRTYLCEVKGGVSDLSDLRKHTTKIGESGWVGHALLLGATPIGKTPGALGLYTFLNAADKTNSAWKRGWVESTLERLDYHAMLQRCHHRIETAAARGIDLTNPEDDSAIDLDFDRLVNSAISKTFAKASNATQWRRR
jgi:hypothetical protein